MTGQRVIAGGLFVDCGDGYEIRDGDRAGEIRYKRPPRARYECLRPGCIHRVEGPVTGPHKVAEFVAQVRQAHNCQAPPTT